MFSASEQKYWYETLQFNYSSYPKHCASCRKVKRKPKLLHKKLAELLGAEDQSTEVLTAIAETYAKLGILIKAKLFYAKAKNKLK